MVYGDGDEDLPPAQRLFNRFTVALDIIGHELTHGVTQHTGNLNYWGSPARSMNHFQTCSVLWLNNAGWGISERCRLDHRSGPLHRERQWRRDPLNEGARNGL
jgi:hypothetical protein